MSVLADFRFDGLSPKSLDGATTAKLTAVSAGTGTALTTTTGLAGWGSGVQLRDALVLDQSSRITVPLAGVTAVEMVIRPSAMTDEGNLFSGPGSAISLRMIPLSDGRPYLQAIAHLTTGDVTIEAPEVPLNTGTWQTLGAALTGDEFVLAVRGTPVRRTVLHTPIPIATSAGVTIGDLADGSLPGVVGHLALVRLCDTVPTKMEQAIAWAREDGLGEIDGYWDVLGGANGWVGAPVTPEVKVAGGIYRVFANATLTWHLATGAHAVQGPIRDHWVQLQGPSGILGYPTTDEVDPNAYFRTEKIAHMEIVSGVFPTVSGWKFPLPTPPGTSGGSSGGAGGSGGSTGTGGSGGGSGGHQDTTTVDISGMVVDTKANWVLAAAADDENEALTKVVASPGLGQNGPGLLEIIAKQKARMSRFQGGAIVTSQTTGTWEVHGDIALRWFLDNGTLGNVGRPIADTESDGAGASRSRFESGTIFTSPSSGTHMVYGAIHDKVVWLPESWPAWGLPISDVEPILDKNEKKDGGLTCRFTNANVWFKPGLGAHVLPPVIRDLYLTNGGPMGVLGYPTGDIQDAANKTAFYMQFERGLVIWTADRGARIMGNLELKLDNADAPDINDGYDGFLTTDRTAELFVKVTITRDGATLPGWDKRRIPSGNLYRSKKVTFADEPESEDPILFENIRAGTTIGITFEGWDHDDYKTSSSLSGTSVEYDIDTMWGQLEKEHGIHSIVAQEAGKDGIVTYNFSLSDASIGKPRVDQMRELGFWNFDNFKTATLPYTTYNLTFVNVEARGSVWDLITDPIDELYYQLVYKDSADSGNCEGMADLARRSDLGLTMFTTPLNKWYSGKPYVEDEDVPPTLHRQINIRHGVQLGTASLMWVLDHLLDGSALYPSDTYVRIRSLLQSGDLPLIGMFNVADFKGHTVMAYHYRDAYGANPAKIFVCDPNRPWTPQDKDFEKSRIEFDNGGFQFFDQTGNDGKNNRYWGTAPSLGSISGGPIGMALSSHAMILEFPSHVLDEPIRTPVWDILQELATGIGGLLLFAGDVSTSQLASGGKNFYGSGHVSAKTYENLKVTLGPEAADAIASKSLHGYTALHAALNWADPEKHTAPIKLQAGSAGNIIKVKAADVASAINKVGLIKLAEAINPVVNIGAIPGLMRLPSFDAGSPGELFLSRGPLPRDLRVDWQATASGAGEMFMRAPRAAIGLKAAVAADERGSLQLDGVGREHPRLVIGSDGPGSSVTVDYATQRTRSGWEPRRLKATIPVGKDGPTMFAPIAGLGVEITSAVAGPATQVEIHHSIGDETETIKVGIPALKGGDKVTIRPWDLGSPLGAQVVEHTASSGKVSKKTVTPKIK